ncbi:MAG: DUF4157 domain-containing protein, partial [Actinomycetota bacterium]|nr:DUF4157 domain-containing protein [Actinomycetota bacterium]
PDAPPAEGGEGPLVAPPDAVGEQPEERDAEETYLVYVYDQLERFLSRAPEPTAPRDEELRRAALERLDVERRETASPPPPGVVLPPPLEEETPTGGRPLTPETRGRMEAVFGEDLSKVRVHTDESAKEGARSVGARAYAVGRDVYFAAGRSPESDEELLAHEITHVVQEAGDQSERLSEPTDELEKEAEETARAVKRGEKPEPITKRKGRAGVHRAPSGKLPPGAPDPPPAPGKSSKGRPPVGKRKMDSKLWNAIQSDTELLKDKDFADAIAALDSKPKIDDKVADAVYDAAGNRWVPRAFVPMRFPGDRYLSHYSVRGKQQIKAGEFLERGGGDQREDDKAQNQLSRLMYESVTARAGVDEKDTGPWFTKSATGDRLPALPTRDAAWADYRDNDERAAVTRRKEKLNSEPDMEPGQQTSVSVWNKTLTMNAFDMLWNGTAPGLKGAQYVWMRGQWINRTQFEPDQAAPATAAPAATAAPGGTVNAAATRQVFQADYESHHVIPLWLRSASGKPDGDQLDNLVPWHHSAHQTNHGYHHKVPKDVKDITKVTDYRDFRTGVRFQIRPEDGNAVHDAEPPHVKLNTSNEWEHNPGGPAWMP